MKRSTRKWDGAKSCVQGDKQVKKLNKGNGVFRARSHPTKFPVYGKEIRKSLEPFLGLVPFPESPGMPAEGMDIREWNQSQRKKCAAANKAERSWRSEERFDIRHVNTEFRDFSADFQSYFGSVVSYYAPFLMFWSGNICSVSYVGSI